jgi:hypothetical protein
MRTILRRLTVACSLLTLLSFPALTRGETSVQDWVQRYNGPGNGSDWAYAVAVDSSNNVVVTGYASSSGSGRLFATLKYSSTGMPLWTNLYHGPGTGDDTARAVVVDVNNDVIVTGWSQGSGGGVDYATIKYSSGGVPLWTNRYNATGNGYDQPNALALDSSNNVVVTGWCNSDYATIKYSGDGVPLWTNRYNGPGNGTDRTYAVGVDRSDNVIVTGVSQGSGGSYDYATIKYSSAGIPLWTNRYPNPGTDYYIPFVAAVDRSNNVVVIGSVSAIKYSSLGVPLWTNLFSSICGSFYGHAGAVDGNDDVIVAGDSHAIADNADYVTIKYSGAGALLWTNSYNGPGNAEDWMYAAAVDRHNNVVVTGWSMGSSGNFDYATIKYSGDGVPLWTNRYNGIGSTNNGSGALAFDQTGAVLVTGWSYGSGSWMDFATIKYTSIPSPAITGPPASLTVCAGSPATFSVGATGEALAYQWQVSADGGTTFTNISDTATNVSCTNPTTALGENNTQYRVIISGAYSPARTSAPPAVLTVGTPATANAGGNQMICSASNTAGLGGSVGGGATGGIWTSSGSGSFVPNATTLNAAYAASLGDLAAGTVTLMLTSTGQQAPCGQARAQIVVTVNPLPSAPVTAGASICGAGVVSLTASGSGGTLKWYADPGLTTLVNTGSSYAPTVAGTTTYYVTETSAAGCVSTVSAVTVTVKTPATVAAGGNQTVCSSSCTAGLGGLVGGSATGGIWTTTGSGTFLPSATTANANYSPSAGDLAVGAVTLTLTTTGQQSPCGAATAQVVVNISPLPSAPVTTGASICGAGMASLAASGSGGTLKWYADAGLNTLVNTGTNYAPTVGASTTYYVTETSAAGCRSVASPVAVTVNTPATASAGGNQTICSISSTAGLDGSVGGGATSGAWSTSGSGTFSPDATTLNATYCPSAGDIAAGAVTLALTSTGQAASCDAATAHVGVIINIFGQASATQSLVDNHDGTYILHMVGTPGARYYAVYSGDIKELMPAWTPVVGSTNTADGDGKWSCVVSNPSPAYYRPVAVNPAP